jgi:hypothetical protein
VQTPVNIELWIGDAAVIRAKRVRKKKVAGEVKADLDPALYFSHW